MASMVPAIHTAADMETNTSTGALIPHGLFFQGNPMHLAKRQSGINKRAIPVYTLDVQNKDGELQMVWSALNQQTNTLEDIMKEKERVEKMLVELKENDEMMRQRLLQLEGTMRQSETSEQMPEQQEDIDMDGADLPNIDDATLDDASVKELLKMCTLFLKAAVTGKAQLRKDNPVRYSPSKKMAARMEQREQMSKNEINALQRFIHKQFLILTGISMLEEFISYEPVEESLVIAFHEGTGNGPEDEFYTLDFSPSFRGLRWNRIIINNMVGVVQAELLQEGHLVDVDNMYIKETLWNLLSSAQQKWAAVIPCFKKGKPELETEAEVVDHLMETGRQANAKVLSHAAKDRKHKTRTTIVKKIIYLKTKQRNIWARAACLWRRLRSDRLEDWLESLEEDDREEMAVSEEVFELLEHAVPKEVTVQEVE
ncbi:hypothetical protein EDD18DRAFT_1106593 [Armillaria luteobubalina]|uniref:Uncharacterized protein n=1 Tax=Armillaria luteobubalina TaxID=153913 RepID=A0AA39Q3G6_9AGAR|nr:hypothetical protein EDD18DRAFT_1106593 [Armillaria luteobubalina]